MNRRWILALVMPALMMLAVPGCAPPAQEQVDRQAQARAEWFKASMANGQGNGEKERILLKIYEHQVLAGGGTIDYVAELDELRAMHRNVWGGGWWQRLLNFGPWAWVTAFVLLVLLGVGLAASVRDSWR